MRVGLAVLAGLSATQVHAHDGPPYPIVTDQEAGAYSVSIWTDPDTTDDGSAGGQFWVILSPAAAGATVPADTRVTVAIERADGPGARLEATAVRERADQSRWFAALPMDREGRFRVVLSIEDGREVATLETQVDATYDERPAPILLVLYAVPFLLAGLLWLNVLIRRRQVNGRRSTDMETSRD